MRRFIPQSCRQVIVRFGIASVLAALLLVAPGAGSSDAQASAPPSVDALTEGSASSWDASADDATASVHDESVRVRRGFSCVRLETDGGADVRIWAPAARDAHWDMSSVRVVSFAAYSEVPTIGFQNDVPWIRLGTTEDDYIELTSNTTALNECINEWHTFAVPLDGDSAWTRTEVGNPDLSDINYIEIHADTWDYGFTLWVDALRFIGPPPAPDELTEGAAADWRAGLIEGAELPTISNDTARSRVGPGSLRVNTGPGRTSMVMWALGDDSAQWDMSGVARISFWLYCENSESFGPQSPMLRLSSGDAGFIDYVPVGNPLENATGKWTHVSIPTAGSNSWTRMDSDSPDMAHIRSVQIFLDSDGPFSAWLDGLTFSDATPPAPPSGWPQKHRDMWNTGRADFAVPDERLNDHFFDIFLWQTRSPNSPGEGGFGATQMTFMGGAGPEDKALVTGTYHWPKGVQAMDTSTGEALWTGNPAGGESIGEIAAAFSNDGQTIYVTNDATEEEGFPSGHPLMAFASETGPGSNWHNGLDSDPDALQTGSPKISPDGRIFAQRWSDRPNAAIDTGTTLSLRWSASEQTGLITGVPALFDDTGQLKVIAGGRNGLVSCFDGESGDVVWKTDLGLFLDVTPTVDPANGNIYMGAGNGCIYIVGLDINGAPLWDMPAKLVYDFQEGSNSPHLAVSGGCLSQDGATYYFQTNSEAGDGELIAVNTSDGSLKWTYSTQSRGWDMASSSPIVTSNGVIVVGNNENNTYFALKDDAASATLIDSLAVEPGGNARASASISPEGTLFLPVRTIWTAYQELQPVPTMAAENLFCAIGLQADAQGPPLAPPAVQGAIALNHAVRITWKPIVDPAGIFDHYAVYRDTSPFTSVEGMTPIATVTPEAAPGYLDTTAENGVSYHYAVTTVDTAAREVPNVVSVGPRTPRNETDLQVVSIARTPRFPRYSAQYSWFWETEPSGFGPYLTQACSGLGDGQDANTKRFPSAGETVTYTATVRNRGTNPWSGTLAGVWRWDGATADTPSRSVTLEPGGTASFDLLRSWDGASHDVSFAVSAADARAANNSLSIDTKAAGFLTYVDTSKIEQFREVTASEYPQAETDDLLDWLNQHMARFNALFDAAGTDKRVRYDVLQVLNDTDPDPSVNSLDWAIFPFRYRAVEGDPRWSGYYSRDEDIDYGLLHEMGHQLGLIDIYQLDVPPDANLVNGQGYSAVTDLMRGCSPVLSPASALPMQHWLDIAHGYFGVYLYNLPSEVRLRILDYNGNPLAGATVKMYQYCEREGMGKVIANQIKAQGTTGSDGIWTLPNVPVDPAKAPPAFTGDTLRDNPFGYVSMIGTNGVLLFRVEYGGGVDYCWLDITEANTAYYGGQTLVATFDRQLGLGGPVQSTPPDDMAEMNASDWSAWVEGGTGTLTDDTARKTAGAGSVEFITNGGYDNYLRYPRTFTANWDIRPASCLVMDIFTENPNFGFQSASPWVRLRDADGDYAQYQFWWQDILNESMNKWRRYVIPLNASPTEENGWRRTDHGTVDFQHISALEIHADTWGFGFTLWLDSVRFGYSGATAHGVAAAKAAPDGNLVDIAGVTVSAVFDNTFSIISLDRAMGLRVDRYSHGLWAGRTVNISGIMGTNADGERYIEATSVAAAGEEQAPAPLFVSNRNAGGAATQGYNAATGAGQAGVTGGRGLNSIGQFVAAYGQVTYMDPGGQAIVISDGSSWGSQALSDGAGHTGIRVDAWHSVPYQLKVGDFVTVRGVVSCRRIGQDIYPLIRAYNIVQEYAEP